MQRTEESPPGNINADSSSSADDISSVGQNGISVLTPSHTIKTLEKRSDDNAASTSNAANAASASSSTKICIGIIIGAIIIAVVVGTVIGVTNSNKNNGPSTTPHPFPQPTIDPTLQPTLPPTQQSTPPPTPTPSSAKPTALILDQRGNDLDGEAAGDRFGYSISLSTDGSILAVGTPYNDGNGGDAGHVRVFEWTGTTWSQRGNDLDGEVAGDNFGVSVSLSSDGSILAVGAFYNDGGGGDAGRVHVFEWTGTTWSHRGNALDGEAAGDNFGFAVSLSSDGSVLAVGAGLNDGKGINAGHVRVFEWRGTSWSQRGNDLDGDGETANNRVGWAVSLSSDGSVLAVGSPYHDGIHGTNVGHVRVLEWTSTTWSRRGNDLDGDAAYDYFGYSVSLSSDGSILAVGTIQHDDAHNSNAGHVREFEWTGTAWSQRGNDLDGEAAGDRFGHSVSLSSDGSVLAVGAVQTDGTGEKVGHVRVFEWTGTTWSQRGNALDGEAAADNFGVSVSLSSDGSVLAVGAYSNDGKGGDAGHVRVFEWTSTT